MTARRIINVYVGDRLYRVDLDAEQVWGRTFRNCSHRWVRTTSRRIETSAILRASDAWHRGETIAPQDDVPQESRDLLATMECTQ